MRLVDLPTQLYYIITSLLPLEDHVRLRLASKGTNPNTRHTLFSLHHKLLNFTEWLSDSPCRVQRLTVEYHNFEWRLFPRLRRIRLTVPCPVDLWSICPLLEQMDVSMMFASRDGWASTLSQATHVVVTSDMKLCVADERAISGNARLVSLIMDGYNKPKGINGFALPPNLVHFRAFMFFPSGGVVPSSLRSAVLKDCVPDPFRGVTGLRLTFSFVDGMKMNANLFTRLTLLSIPSGQLKEITGVFPVLTDLCVWVKRLSSPSPDPKMFPRLKRLTMRGTDADLPTHSSLRQKFPSVIVSLKA